MYVRSAGKSVALSILEEGNVGPSPAIEIELIDSQLVSRDEVIEALSRSADDAARVVETLRR